MNEKTKEMISNPAGKLMGDVLSLENESSPREPNSPIAQSAGNPAGSAIQDDILREQIIETIQTVYDPEIPVNIYELGLIYDLVVESGEVWVKMTLTSPACPVAGTLPIEVENKIAAVPGVENVELELVWDPPYTMEMMSESARLQLGLMW
jgi:FeS assembly SUF system protein